MNTTTAWSGELARRALRIYRVPFDAQHYGHLAGYSVGNVIAVREGALHETFVELHEIAHVVLGHSCLGDTGDRTYDELEAEVVACTVAALIGLDEDNQWSPAGSEVYIESLLSLLDRTDLSPQEYRRLDAVTEKIIYAGTVGHARSPDGRTGDQTLMSTT